MADSLQRSFQTWWDLEYPSIILHTLPVIILEPIQSSLSNQVIARETEIAGILVRSQFNTVVPPHFDHQQAVNV